jgi:hypothetical protein
MLSRVLRGLALALPALLAGTPLLAQSSYQSPLARPYAYQGDAPYRLLDTPSFIRPWSRYAPPTRDATVAPWLGGGIYRTLCVRLCDGYYFPISHATGSSGLRADAEACSASCGSEARLFYHANPGGSAESMIDLAGRAYTSLSTAFKYRKTLVPDCRCRPQPWSETELARHRAYAAGPGGAATAPQAEPSGASSAGASGETVGAPRAPHGPDAVVPRDAREGRQALPASDERIITRPEPVARTFSGSDVAWPLPDPGAPISPRSRYFWSGAR